MLTNSEQWEEAAVLASRLSGDLLFPIPYCPELQFIEFASTVADMKNSVAVSSLELQNIREWWGRVRKGVHDKRNVWCSSCCYVASLYCTM